MAETDGASSLRMVDAGSTLPGVAPLDAAPLLTARVAGHAVMTQALAVQAGARPRSPLGRLLGLSPLSTEAAPWFSGALGERHVGALLSRLGREGEAWRVLHAVPVGTRGADIDHVVVGPCGVVTLNTKHHPGQRVWVAGRSVLVTGHRQPYVRNAEHEAERAARLLSAALGRPVPVRAAVVVVGASSLTVKQQPDAVTVLSAARLVRWLQRRPVVLSPAEVRQVARAAAQPGTWQRRPESRGSDPRPAFERLAADVASAARRRVLVLVGTAATVVALAGTSLLAWLG